jgi:signal transduction histidine kinase
MYLTSKENERLQQMLTNVSVGCNCKSCQTLSKEKNKLKELLDELKQTQAHLIQSEKMAALGKLTAGFIHEINNPIGAMNCAVDVSNRCVNKILEIFNNDHSTEDNRDNRLLQTVLKALQDNNLATIKASKRITKILYGMSSFIQLDASTLQKIDLHEALDGILPIFNHELDNRIIITKKYGDIPVITCHAAELNQVFVNLFRNAVQSIREKGKIIIRTFSENNNVFIQIIDTGIGIPPQQIQNLFEPMFSKKETRVKAGMGLFISLNIVKKHHGQIKVESKVGKGSTFTIILPKERIVQNSIKLP